MMKKLIGLVLILLTFTECGGDEPQPTSTTSPSLSQSSSTITNTDDDLSPKQPPRSNKMNIYIHYMPWFETPSTNGGQWGQHWTMATCNPNKIDGSGKREIASYYYPLTGPYASSDEAILDYQCLLMKYAGADGVMIDWYGTRNRYDYPANHRNTLAMIKAIEKAGMKYVIVYEDATLEGLADKTTQAIKDLKYLQDNCFGNDSYAKVNKKPLLMTFGPQQVTSPSQWAIILQELNKALCFVCLNGHSSRVNNNQYPNNAAGEFTWVDPTPNYSAVKSNSIHIGGAMPGFRDFYKEGNWGSGYTTYEREDGSLFKRQMKLASDAGLSWLQITTWNDYGEGTTIEPTLEYGYDYLEMLQQFAGVKYDIKVLKLVKRWYDLKVKYPADSNVATAYKYLASLNTSKAEEIIVELEKYGQ